MKFWLTDFQECGIDFPKTFLSMHNIKHSIFNELEENNQEHGDSVETTLAKLKARMPEAYYIKMYRAQSSVISFSERAFPAYKFILPDSLWDDWLAIIDPHKDHSRDHSLHQPLTAYVAAKLLKGNSNEDPFQLKTGETLLEYCSNVLLNGAKTKYLRDYFKKLYPDYNKIPLSLRSKLAKVIFYNAAVTAAVFHDIGYPWQYVNRLTNHMQTIDKDFASSLGRDADSIITMMNSRLQIYPFYGYKDTAEIGWHEEIRKIVKIAFSNTHGFPGAVCFSQLSDLLRNNNERLSLNEAINKFIVDWSTVAIMMHDMPGMNKKKEMPTNFKFKVSFDEDPLSSLVSLCDILEDFERPGLSITHDSHKEGVDENSVLFNIQPQCVYSEMECNGDQLVIRYAYADDASRIRYYKFRTGEVSEYLDSPNGYINIAPIGFTSAKCECVTDQL